MKRYKAQVHYIRNGSTVARIRTYYVEAANLPEAISVASQSYEILDIRTGRYEVVGLSVVQE